MGFAPRNIIFAQNMPEYRHTYPITKSTNNNKLQLSARSLELIYTLTDWPPESLKLPVSLKESGKSRADLWQFAGKLSSNQLYVFTIFSHFIPIQEMWL